MMEQGKQTAEAEAKRVLMMATQALERATSDDSDDDSEKESDNKVEKQIESVSEAISKIGDAIKEFSIVSTQNTQSALSMIQKPKRIVRENGRVARIETE